MSILPRSSLEGAKDAVVAPVRLQPADDAYHQVVGRDAEGRPDIGHGAVVDVDARRQQNSPFRREREALDVLRYYACPVGRKAVGPGEEALHGETHIQTVPLVVGPDEERPLAAAEKGERRHRVVVGQVGVDDIDLALRRERADGAYVEKPVPDGEIPVEPQVVVRSNAPLSRLLSDGPLTEVGRRPPEGEDHVDAGRCQRLAQRDDRLGRAGPLPVAEEYGGTSSGIECPYGRRRRRRPPLP